MQDVAFEQYMLLRGLADVTRKQRGYALKRIEKAYDCDLDQAFDDGGLSTILQSLSYTASDDRLGQADPSKLDIESDKLLTHLRWYRSHIADYVRFRGGSDELASSAEPTASELVAVQEAVGKTFALERDLQTALRQNISQLEQGLVIADDGSEKRVEAGFIDILARDAKGVLTVIELKAEVARPEAVAQVLGYMGCVAEETGEAVRGFLVAADHHPRVVHAARAVPALMLKKYRYQFEFE